ncbi:hypothetical protein DXG03_002341 [Asterophora parasitica]|uniref:F-box domain-containing protein n=1 Tax=Asterophora parasitica TaxID=117018 RepID=A0A9P7G313_9AGAR|nr:hypothetical protein DXG03_002341 [Asterophora parasitica]
MMHHALIISDVLGFIFKFTDTSTNVACARVCKAWQENVLDVLWNRVDRLDRLLRLVGPMEEINSYLTFVQSHISNDRWERFTFYANLVRYLEVTDRPPEIHHQSFSTLAITRPVLHILPNLTHLTWKKDPSSPPSSLFLCLLFLNPGLKSLSVETGRGSEQGDLFAIGNFFNDVVHRSPCIENLEFRSKMLFRDIGPCLSKFFIGLRCLKTVLLSDTLLTSDVITALAKCPLLESVRMIPMFDSFGTDEGEDVRNFIPVIEHGAFPQLQEMEIRAHLWNVVSLLQSEFPAGRLWRLVVRTLIMEDNASIAAFFTQVAEACHGLEVLALSVQKGSIEDDSENYTFASLQPILRCTSLTAFTLKLPLPLDIDDTEASLIASAWPRGRHLILNPFPTSKRPTRKHITLDALMAFAQCCPEIQSLGLFILPSFISQSPDRKVMPKLDSLKLGLSGVLYTVENLALFLADITPLTCSVTGASYLHDIDSAEAHRVARVKWRKVIALLPTLRSIHAQYQTRLRALEAEVHRLSLLAASATMIEA